MFGVDSINTLYGSIKLKLAILTIMTSVIFSFICLFSVKSFVNNYIVSNLGERAKELSSNVVSKLGYSSFEYDSSNALAYSSFNVYKHRLGEIRKTSDLNALYILKETNNKIVYIVSSFDSYKDFYGLGNEIDDEIRQAAEAALLGNEYVSRKPVNVDEEKVILCSCPVYDRSGNLVGAVGMEFGADVIVSLNKKIKGLILFLIPITVGLIAFSFIFLKKSINDITEVVYTDDLTKLKNRLAYEKAIDDANAMIKKNPIGDPKIGVIIYDLNDLKIVNDTLGHLAGDKYITNSAKIIKNCFEHFGKTYRIGGDEFATIIEDNSPEKISEALSGFEKAQEKYNIENNSRPFIISIAVGYDYFVPGADLNLASVIKRADEKMYKVKKEKKAPYSRSPR